MSVTAKYYFVLSLVLSIAVAVLAAMHLWMLRQ
jgi:hypothetical protein